MVRTFVFSGFLLTISACVHSLLAIWAMRVSPWLGARRRTVWAIVACLVVITPAARMMQSAWHGSKSQQLFAAGMIEASVVAISMIPLFLIHIGLDLGVGLRKRWGKKAEAPDLPHPSPPADLAPPNPGALEFTRRQMIEGVGGATVLAGTGSALGWGIVRGRHAFEIEEVPVRIVGLPRALDGYTIAQVSDIHVGLFVGDRELREGFERVLQTKPDLIVATGDLVDHDEHYIAQMARALGSLGGHPRDGVTAILGNHDYYTGAQDVLAGLRAAGVRTLVNEGLVLRGRDQGGFSLLGVADMFAIGSREEPPSLERALAMVPPDRPRILLAHQPQYFPVARGRVALQLSGHTHGGQINPGFRPASLFMRYLAGRYEEQGSTLWVNRGFGVAGPPSRVGAAPEVTKIILVSA
ncbi:metallophosphoesterase [Pendulispora rubella]|uniref:Metallophosphoesterase n=1 Tax=Pendulispora rubella TaxID=2741070 RepID=A0ABZ2L343_9BACT